MDTIFALASAAGKAGVAVVRLSGPAAVATGQAICGPLPAPRVMELRRITVDDMLVDRALVVWFRAGASFTGEDVVEFHCHGSAAVIGKLLKSLGKMERLRLARPGEFTRRALEAGRLDLTQVESLADLIEAETEAQRRQALRLLDGALATVVAGWRRDLVQAMAQMAVCIDFSDEDVPDNVATEVRTLVTHVCAGIAKEMDGLGAAERVRTGFEVAIVGPPNIGKSTLLNTVARREVAITSEHAGTTRDVIEVRLEIGELPVTLLDTAGIRDSQDPVERLGIDRAINRAKGADMRVFLVESATDVRADLLQVDDVVVYGKGDLIDTNANRVSGLTGDGVDTLLSRIEAVLRRRAVGAGLVSRARHSAALVAADRCLNHALCMLASDDPSIELVDEELRAAVHALDVLIGKIGVEDVLDDVFKSFCLGK